MYLDPWMIGVIALMFGLCAWTSRRSGIVFGTVVTLQKLVDDKIVMVENDEIVPYRNAWAPKPTKRRKGAQKVAK
jgi:hypothetical protein